MLRERTPRRWLFLAVVALGSAALTPWAYARTDAGVVSVSGISYGGAEILVLAAVAALLLVSGRAKAAAYIALLATGYSALVLYNLPVSLSYETVWDTELTAGPALAVLGSLMLFVATAISLRQRDRRADPDSGCTSGRRPCARSARTARLDRYPCRRRPRACNPSYRRSSTSRPPCRCGAPG